MMLRSIHTFFLFLFFSSSVLLGQNSLILSDFDPTIPYETIRVHGHIQLELIASDSVCLLSKTSYIPSSFKLEQKNGRLYLKAASEIKKDTTIHLVLYTGNFSRLEAVRGAIVQSHDTIRNPNLVLVAGSGGKAQFKLVADSVSVRVNEGADVILYGRTSYLYVNAGTMGVFHGYELEAKEALVKANSGAFVKVFPENLVANATSKASISYKGKPAHVTEKISMGGKISHVDQ